MVVLRGSWNAWAIYSGFTNGTSRTVGVAPRRQHNLLKLVILPDVKIIYLQERQAVAGENENFHNSSSINRRLCCWAWRAAY